MNFWDWLISGLQNPIILELKDVSDVVQYTIDISIIYEIFLLFISLFIFIKTFFYFLKR